MKAAVRDVMSARPVWVSESTSFKEIAARLFLSPRTVSTHLYQVFPKLGIASRAALLDALADLPPE